MMVVMKENVLQIEIRKPVEVAFAFAVTPPNSKRWIPGVIDEKTNEWPVKKGTIYTLIHNDGRSSTVVVRDVEVDSFIEWTIKDHYFCRYEFEVLGSDLCQLTYREYVTRGEIEHPFDRQTLQALKIAIETIAE